MLAGLIFATEEAEDRPDTLAATLPFGGMTLIEYQARLLVGAGAGQILVAVARVTPALLGAVSRASKRGVPIDVVRSAEEAATKVHPLARVLVLADGLVTTDPVIDKMAGEGSEALLVTRNGDSPAAVERLDAQDCWAGIARVPAERLIEIARMPPDWDFQSALLRVAVQHHAEHVVLSNGAAKGGHGIERSAAALASRSNAVLAALTERRVTWADRWVFTRVARLILPDIVQRNIPAWTILAGGTLFGLLGLVGIGATWQGLGLLATLPAIALFATGGALAALRGEDRRAALLEGLIAFFSATAILLAGLVASRDEKNATALILAIVLIAIHAVSERVPVRHRRWWASPAAYPLLLTPFGLVDFVTIGLGTLALYAFGTLAAAVEASREKA